MSVAAVSSTAANTLTAAQLAALNSTNQAVGGQKTLGQDDFLKLLTVQLQSQDPLKPMDDTQFISQMATFSSLTQMQTLTTDFTDFSKDQLVANAQSYLGKTVTVAGASGNITGSVTGVDISSGAPQLTVNGVNYTLASVRGISLPTANTSAATTGVSTN